MDIRYVPQDKINYFKWDRCIDRAINGSIFGYTWYLNIVSPRWDALVKGDYEAVMPIPVNRLMGMEYIYQPMLCPELGIFSIKSISTTMVAEFLSSIPPRFKWYSMALNKYNPIPANVGLKKRQVFELDLIQGYEQLVKNYGPLNTIALQKAIEIHKISVVKGMMPNEFLKLLKPGKIILNPKKFLNIYSKLRIIASTALKYRLGQLYAAYTRENNLCAAILFLWSHRRVNVLYVTATKEAVQHHAIEAIINQFIKEHATFNLTLAFENSDKPSRHIKMSGFGAQAFVHPVVHSSKNTLISKISNSFSAD